jgi:predicted secreted protein
MKMVIGLGLFLVVISGARAAEKPAATAVFEINGKPAETAANKVATSQAEFAVGETFEIKLRCNPTTGYNWELKSINRKIAVPTGEVEFRESPAKPGTVGVGGNCVLGIKGVKPGKTKAVLVYRRSWEKGKPAETFTAEIKVLPKKKS